ncbi:MAG: hypothetical protein ACRDKE_13110 [Solirubrobacterales bacterium]
MRTHTLEWRCSATNTKLIGIAAALFIALLCALTTAQSARSATIGINTTITSAPPAATSDTTPTFAFTSNVAGASFQCSVDSGSFKTCVTPFTTAVLSQGSHSFRVRAIKSLLIDLTPATSSFKVDSIAPVVKITAPLAGSTTASSVVLKFTATDSSGTPTCDRVNNSTVALAYGSNTITVRCTDAAGNVGQASVVVTRPDTVAPIVKITSPVTGSTTAAGSIAVTFTATDNSGAAPTCAPANGSAVALALGSNVITVRCTDAAGNVGQASVTVTRTDNVAPTITGISPADGFSTDEASVTLTFVATDNSGVAPTCNRPPAGSTINLNLGANSITIDCVDGAGNHTIAQVLITRVNPPDTTPPVVEITSPVADGDDDFDFERGFNPVELGGSGASSCAIDASGAVKCWGWNESGQLGDGTLLNRPQPVTVVGLGGPVAEIDGEQRHTCARLVSGGVQCWGWNIWGQLGDGSFTDRSMPTDVSGLASGVRDIAGGGSFNCALTTSGGVKCWGRQMSGQLGNGVTNLNSATSPVDVVGLQSGVESMDSGDGHSCALLSSGDVKCWGANNYGQLGDGTETNRSTPVSVVGISGPVKAVATGSWRTCVLLVSGGVECWGWNQWGQLGDGTTSDHRSTPGPVSNITDAVALSAGGEHTCALRSSGQLSCWGSDGWGARGDGPTSGSLVPTDVLGMSSTADFFALGNHACALTTSGDVKCWGYNIYGQVGNGTFVDVDAPSNVIGMQHVAGPPPLVFTVSEVGATIDCAIDGGAASTCTSPFDTSSLAAGLHTVSVTATDAAGNVGSDSIKIEIHLPVEDRTPPDTMMSGPTGTITDTTPTYVLSSNEAGSIFECRVDGTGFWREVESPWDTWPPLATGPHVIECRAIDTSGNIDTTPASVSVAVGSNAPDTAMSGPTGNTNDTTPTYSLNATLAGSNFQCSVDNGSFVATGASFTPAALSVGSHTIRCRAGLSGVYDPTPATATIFVDNVAPTISQACAAQANSSIRCTFSASDPSMTVPGTGGAPGTCIALYPSPCCPVGMVCIATPTCVNYPAMPGYQQCTYPGTPPTVVAGSGVDRFECSVDGGASTTCTSPFVTAVLPPGSHTVTTRAFDRAGNVATATATATIPPPADITPPVVTITSPGGGWTFNNAAALSFTVSEPATTTCSIDGGAALACASPRSYFNLTQANHTFVVSATDTAGNVGSATTTLYVNYAADLYVQPPDGSSFNSTTVTMRIGIFYDGGPGTCSLDDGPFVPCSLPFTYTGLSAGGHKFRMIEPGVLDWTSRFTVDLTAPSLSVSSPASGYVSTDGSVPVSFSTEIGSRTSCRIDSGTTQSCDSGATLTGVLAGAHTLTIESSDVAGNKTTATRSFSVDVPVVDANFKSPIHGSWSRTTSLPLTFDNIAGYTTTCAVDGGAAQACTSPHSLSGLGQGAHSATVTWLSGSGVATSFTHAFSVDSIAPQLDVQNLVSGQVVTTSSYDVEFTVSDANLRSNNCNISSGTSPPNPTGKCVSPATYSDLFDGPHTIFLSAYDEAGNSTFRDIPFTVTGNPGIAVIYSSTASPTRFTEAWFNFHHQSPQVTQFQCRVDAAPFAACTNGYHAIGLTEGSHEFQVRGVRNGVPDATAASKTITVDTVKPDTSITAGGGSTADTTPTVEFASSEPNSTFTCRLDNGVTSACTSPYTTPELYGGRHTLVVIATDAAGNNDYDDPAVVGFTIEGVADTQPPETTITSGPSGSTTDSTPTFLFTSSEVQFVPFAFTCPPGNSCNELFDATNYECRVDGGAWQSCGTAPDNPNPPSFRPPFTSEVLPAGAHTFEVQAHDYAGNIDPTPALRSFTVS